MEEKERVLQEETNATIAGKRLTDFIIPLAEFGTSEQAQVQNNVCQYCYLRVGVAKQRARFFFLGWSVIFDEATCDCTQHSVRHALLSSSFLMFCIIALLRWLIIPLF